MWKQILFTVVTIVAVLYGDKHSAGQVGLEGGFDDFSSSTAIVTVDPNGNLGGDFTNGFFPDDLFDVVWIDFPEHGAIEYDPTLKLLQYVPSPLNQDAVDQFTVYATDDDFNWNITTFFFDPETQELTFVTDVTNKREAHNISFGSSSVFCSTVLGVYPRDGWTRFWGGVKLVGGVLETAGGVVIGVGTSWTGVGAVAGGGIAAHGLDTTQAGIRQLWYGEEVRTFTSQAVSGTAHHVFGVDENTSVVIGEFVDAGVGIAGGVGTAAKGPQIVDKFGDVFELSSSVRVAVAGGGHIDHTVSVTLDISGVVRAGGIIVATSQGGHLYSSIPDFPGSNPAQVPSGYEWRGKPGSSPGSKDGNYYNPNTGESMRPDLSHPEPLGPHWDYRDPNGNWWRIFPDNRKEPK